MATKTKNSKESEKYEVMLNKVETIIENINNESIPLDELLDQVKEGYSLISQMKSRLEETKEKVETLNEQFTSES